MVVFLSSRRRHTRCSRDWSSDVCSSDLRGKSVNNSKVDGLGGAAMLRSLPERAHPEDFLRGARVNVLAVAKRLHQYGILREMRSEEHTSELQSRLHLVCRLLLEKKKKERIRYSAGVSHDLSTLRSLPPRTPR